MSRNLPYPGNPKICVQRICQSVKAGTSALSRRNKPGIQQDAEFTDTAGFDGLCKHIRDGHKTCRDIEDFFKKRAKAEQNYGKALIMLAKSADGREETGGLGSSWQELKLQTERLAHFHENASSDYSALAEELAKFADDLKQLSKAIEEKMKESQRTKKSAYNKMLDLQKTYNSKCREKVEHDGQLSMAQQSVTVPTKELDKMKSKAEKSKEAMEQSDLAYKQGVEVLERARSSWESEMEEACEQLQKQEEERISFVRNQLWKCTNIDSQLCVDWDESCEKVRVYLEKCDIDKDIQEFIDNNASGCTRPASVNYESYFGERPNGRAEDTKFSQRTMGRHPILPPLPEVPPQLTKKSSDADVYSYATVVPEADKKFRVAKTFIPTGSHNGLVVRRGDIVKLIGPEAKSGPIKVQLEGTTNSGFVPMENLTAI